MSFLTRSPQPKPAVPPPKPASPPPVPTGSPFTRPFGQSVSSNMTPTHSPLTKPIGVAPSHSPTHKATNPPPKPAGPPPVPRASFAVPPPKPASPPPNRSSPSLKSVGSASSAAHATSSPPSSSRPIDSSEPQTCTIKREPTGEVLAQLVLRIDDALTLSQLDLMFKKVAPQTQSYSFIFRGQPIPDAFMSLFKVKQLGGGTTMFIRTKKVTNALSLALNESYALDEDSILKNANNPFLQANDKSVKPTTTSKGGPPPRQQKKAFKKPALATNKPRAALPITPTAAAKGKKPPPPPGSSGLSLGPGASIDDVCKTRAKRLFGAA